MKCRNCGQEIGAAMQCSFCGFVVQNTNVREMSRSEKYNYQGVTIDEGGETEGNGSNENFYGHTSDGRPRFFVRGIQLGHSDSWMDKLMQHYRLSRLLIGLVVAAVMTVLIFVALPIVLMITAIGILIWILLRFLHR